jgi:hypothetical protein
VRVIGLLVLVAGCEAGTVEDDPGALACDAVEAWVVEHADELSRAIEGAPHNADARVVGCSPLTRDGSGEVTAEAEIDDVLTEERGVWWIEVGCQVSGFDQAWTVDACAVTDNHEL